MNRIGICCWIALVIGLFAGCGTDKSTEPENPTLQHLAGGGRESDNDPFIGGPGISGPNDTLPGLPGYDTSIEYFPVYFSDSSCPQQQQFEVFIDQVNWEEWWTEAYDCAGGNFKRNFVPIPDSTVSDSGVIGPDSLWPGEAPIVDFNTHIILVIKLEQGISGRYIWIRSLQESENETFVNYEVSSPADDCLGPLVDPNIFTNPVAAFIVSRPERLTFAWQRSDVTYSCSWVPDPTLPLTLYYTDAICPALGGTEQLIRTSEEFTAWVEAAWECDINRWGIAVDTLWGSDTTVIGDRPLPTFEGMVDFSTHAVLILRADVQTSWGGGIWLDKFEPGNAGTVIEYTVMNPGSACPEVGNGASLQPTVAIRLPLPIVEPLFITRTSDTISCGWVSDSTEVGP